MMMESDQGREHTRSGIHVLELDPIAKTYDEV